MFGETTTRNISKTIVDTTYDFVDSRYLFGTDERSYSPIGHDSCRNLLSLISKTIKSTSIVAFGPNMVLSVHSLHRSLVLRLAVTKLFPPPVFALTS